MAKKSRNKRKSAIQVVESFTRENVLAFMSERDALVAQFRSVDAVIQSMIAAKIEEEKIDTVRALVASGVMERISYLEMNVRRVALAITRAKGFAHCSSIVRDNIEMIPKAETKTAVTLENM